MILKEKEKENDMQNRRGFFHGEKLRRSSKKTELDMKQNSSTIFLVRDTAIDEKQQRMDQSVLKNSTHANSKIKRSYKMRDFRNEVPRPLSDTVIKNYSLKL